MVRKVNKNAMRLHRHVRVRGKISGTPERPRLNVFRSASNIYAQIIDDVTGKTLASANSLEKDFECEGTKTDAANRALAGLSMGGLETMESFMAYPAMFGYINVMSSGWFTNNREMYANGEKRLNEIAATLNKTAKLLLFTQGGPEDIAYNNGKEMLKVFDKCGIKYEFSEMPGGHSWHVWRHDLHNLAPRLFK